MGIICQFILCHWALDSETINRNINTFELVYWRHINMYYSIDMEFVMDLLLINFLLATDFNSHYS